LAVLGTAILFWRVRPKAGGLMIPYLLWLTFALVLNYSMFRMGVTGHAIPLVTGTADGRR
jgi:benzodiazapine receptor